MSDGLQFLDILVFAMVAGFLLLRLHRVLGRRTGHEAPPADPLAEGEENAEGVVPLPDRTRQASRATQSDGDIVAGATGGSGLSQVKIADPRFDEEEFLDGARAAFEIIVGAFANGDKRRLRSLLSDDVYRRFADEIDRRERAAERQETTLVSIVLADIVDARLEGRRAYVTVKIVSEQVNATRNLAGEVVSGDPSQVATVTDIWTLTRDTRLRDPNWQLVETRSPD